MADATFVFRDAEEEVDPSAAETEDAAGAVEADAPADEVAWDDLDLHALVEEIYVLLKRELRVERERAGWR